MLNSFALLSAMGGIQDRYVAEAQSFLGYTGRSSPRSPKRLTKRALLIAAVILLALGVVACSLYYARWSKTLEERFKPTDEEKIAAEESGLSAAPTADGQAVPVASATSSGVTISVQQAIVDNYSAFISLRIEGFEVPEGQYPSPYVVTATVGGERSSMLGGGFVETVNDDGSYDFELALCESTQRGFFIGKEICIVFDGLGVGDKGQYFPLLEDTWELKWTLKGSDELRTVECGAEIGDTGVILIAAEISPITLHLTYKTDGEWEGWKTMDTFQPQPVGVRMRDGSVYLPCFSTAGGYDGYSDIENCIYELQCSSDKIIKTADIDALLFSNLNPYAQELTEADIYVVPLE